MVNVEALCQVIPPEQIITDEVELACYSRDMSIHVGRPEAIVVPATIEQVQAVMAWAHATKTPVTPRGSGTSVTGAILPFAGGIVLDLGRLDRIVEVRRDDGLAVVQAGAICRAINQALEPSHFFAPDPGSSSVCTIGGMVACNASGLRAVKYGTTKDHVLGLKVVLPDGRLIEIGTDAPKSSSGLDLTRLMVSSEGTLGVIVEVTIKILPKPEKVAFARALFDSVEAAGRTVSEILSRGIALSVCEIMDRVSIEVVNKAAGIALPECDAMLLMEVDGHPAAVEDQIGQIRAIALANGALEATANDDMAERERIWRARHALVPSLSRYEAGKRLIPVCEDFGVPISKIPETIRRTQELARTHDILVATFGHVGDGNVHATFMGDVRSASDWRKIRAMGEGLIELALELGGTLTAEHGVGLARSPYLRREHGEGVAVMRAIKGAIDPAGIMNPGKVGLDDGLKDPFDCFAFSDVVGSPPTMRTLGPAMDDEVLVCVQCGFCRAVCPVFAVTGRESTNARGRMILAYDYLAGKIPPSAALAAAFYRCTTCGNCTTACPSRLKVGEVVEACRRELASAGFEPEPLKAAVGAIGSCGNPYQMPAAGRLESYPHQYRAETLTPPPAPLSAALTPPSAPLSPGRGVGGEGPGRGVGVREALVYLGCVPSLIDTKITPAALKLLDQAGVTMAALGERETCCGYLAHLAGDEGAFRAAAAKNRDALAATGAPLVVTPCAGCFKTLGTLYPAAGLALAAEVVHLTDYLLRLIEAGRLKLETPVTARVAYHDPCDLGRHLGKYEGPRQLLRAIPGLELVEMHRNRDQARCCGGGGGVAAVDPELSVAMGLARARDAAEVGAEILVSACAACKKNLSKGAQLLKREGGPRTKLKVMDLSELVLQAAKKA